VVHHAARASVSRAAIAVLLGAAAFTLGACGDESSSGTPAGELGGPAIEGPLQLVSCEDWNAAGTDERLGTIAQIKNFIGGPSGNGGRGAIIDDDVAYDLMEGQCDEDYARGFRLYKLYARAAAFTGH
jgi:hypothetical protein